MNTLLQDIRYGLRMLAKSPGFAAVAIVTLALGIGANTAIFSLIDAVMLRSIPVKDPQSLVVFNWLANKNPDYHSYSNYGDCGRRPEGGHSGCSFSVPLFRDLRAQANAFSGLAAFAGPMQFDLSGNGPASMARGEIVSGEFFSTLGVPTILGRPLGPADDSPNASLAMVLSYNYWQSAFGGERSAVGRAVRVNNIPVEIVGVASPRFTNLAPGKTQDFFLPISALPQVNVQWFGNDNTLNDPYSVWLVIVGRLKPGVSVGQAQSAASLIFRNEMLHGAKPLSKAEDNPRISLVPAEDGLSGQRGHISSLLYVMMIAVGAILLIACANVAGLMLARSAARQKEMAVRLALGAGRARIIRQLLTESVMLSVAGGALGVLLAVWGVHAITTLVTSGSDRPFGFVIAPDWRVLAFTVGVTFVTGILFGLAPALRGTRIDLTPALKETASSLTGGAHAGRAFGRWFRLGDALVVMQVALSILVLVGAGLLVRTLRNLHEINPGFDTQNVLLFGLDPSLIGYKDAQSAQLFRDLRERFAALPGVTSASYSSEPLLAGGLWSTSIHLDGTPRNQDADADALAVGAQFFSTLRIPMLAGRGFTASDFVSAAATQAAETAAEQAWEKAAVSAANGNAAAPAKPPMPLAQFASIPIIVNEAFARKFFPKGSPVGKHIGDYQGSDFPMGAQYPGYTVIGICGDAKYQDLRSKIEPTMYEPFTGGGAHFELRTASSPTALIPAVRSVVAHADNNLPLFEVRTQTEQIEDLLVQERMMARISSFFAVLALALACIGLYGLLSYEVARRTREIGIRMALGAQQGDVLKLVVGQGIVLALVGAAVGIGVAIGVTRFMASMLYGVHANDPATMIAVAVLLALVALAACFIPARRATRVDPMVALRYE
ncbi:MAG TPA: ABC transporter permease [Candidatus Acidoferrales bacterium]|nr:ABC transporter permease [Candidatus Acidoferrales bacterium]